MGSDTGRTGGCLCGAVRYEAAGDPFKTLNCHCESCRRHTGAPMVTLSVFKADQVTFSGDTRRVYESAPGVGRAFCGACGTSMTWETEMDGLGAVVALHISTFDDPDSLAPVAHTFYAERISWFDAADGLPRHEGFSSNSPAVATGPDKRLLDK